MLSNPNCKVPGARRAFYGRNSVSCIEFWIDPGRKGRPAEAGGGDRVKGRRNEADVKPDRWPGWHTISTGAIALGDSDHLLTTP
jgi:hypothetical protein